MFDEITRIYSFIFSSIQRKIVQYYFLEEIYLLKLIFLWQKKIFPSKLGLISEESIKHKYVANLHNQNSTKTSKIRQSLQFPSSPRVHWTWSRIFGRSLGSLHTLNILCAYTLLIALHFVLLRSLFNFNEVSLSKPKAGVFIFFFEFQCTFF